MNNRTKYAVGIVLVVLGLSLPNLLLAQGELTLESLAERVENLFSGQDDLKERLAAVETRLAPTPTRTQRPTATNTPNARATLAAQARATSQVRLTATSQAVKVRLTATARARATEEAGNQLSEVEYLESIYRTSRIGDDGYGKAYNVFSSSPTV